MQYRLSTLLLAFVVVWASLAVFGVAGGIVAAAILLVIAAVVRRPGARKSPRLGWIAFLVGFFLLALLLPAIHIVVDGFGRAGCLRNIAHIGMALSQYEHSNGRLPPAVVTDKQGNAMHSWRTLVMPFILGNASYLAYNFGEPWNGPNNSKSAVPEAWIWRCPADPAIEGRPMTSYVAVTGPGTVWDDHGCTGEYRSVAVVEVVNSNINWMEPKDLTLEEACRGVGDGSGLSISSHHLISGGFFFQDEVSGAYAVLSNGFPCFIPAGLPPDTFRGLFTGEQDARRVCEEFQPVHRHRINWTNCTALAVLILSYAVLLFRPRDKRPPPAEPAPPSPPAAAGDSGSGG